MGKNRSSLASAASRIGWLDIFFSVVITVISLGALVITFVLNPSYYITLLAKHPLFQYPYAFMILFAVFLFFMAIRWLQVRKKHRGSLLYLISVPLVGCFFTLIFLFITNDLL